MNDAPKIKIRGLNFWYAKRQILEDIRLDIRYRSITSITGPSGQGKSSFLTVFNRLWENIDGARATGRVCMDFGNGFEDINHPDCRLPLLRRRVGMVFQMPNPLPMSIRKNMAFPLTLMGEKNGKTVAAKAETALRQALLWDEIKDRLNEDARALSGGQQQRLCIARSLVLEPQVLLLDEPTSSLDEAAVHEMEKLLLRLKKDRTIILVSHYMDQVRRIADRHLVLRDKKLVSP
ncbi:MAG TPA: phosphate ABC transporter ATP-binding protein [Desulfobacteraceae bacterium]|nr:phosphate ABC transporter ATP-binding protein [Desulfobacteraceae bacterium]|tara:strand:+ start:277 stop:978 length:702 start_codon:yes stop_codon:yes gene_type:complete